jgi:SAM-dependent methyltransferase
MEVGHAYPEPRQHGQYSWPAAPCLFRPIGGPAQSGVIRHGELSPVLASSHSLPTSARQYDAIARSWDAEHGPVSARAFEFSERIEYLRALCREYGKPRVLDLGCGTGRTLAHLASGIAAGIGVDISPVMISCARRSAARAPLHFQIGDATDFCRNCRERFELILLLGVIEHMWDQGATLAATRCALAANGRVVIISPHPWNPAFRIKQLIDDGCDAPPSHHLSPSQLRALALHHGFDLCALRAVPYAPWPQWNAWFNAWLGRHGSKSAGAAVCNPLRGVLRGGFAAELCRSGVG